MKNFVYFLPRVFSIFIVVLLVWMTFGEPGIDYDVYSVWVPCISALALGLLAVAWRWPRIGGWLFCLIALGLTYASLDSVVLIGMFIGSVPLVIGIAYFTETPDKDPGTADAKTRRMRRTRAALNIGFMVLFFAVVISGATYWTMQWNAHAWKSPKVSERDVRITGVTGTAFLIRDNATTTATVGAELRNGDRLRTASGEMDVRFYNDARIVLDADTDVTITRISMDPADPRKQTIALRLESGRMWSDVRLHEKEDLASYTVTFNAADLHPKNSGKMFDDMRVYANTSLLVQKAAFALRVQGSVVTIDDDRGKIRLTYGSLNSGLSATFDLNDSQIPNTGYGAAFTTDDARNDPWFRARRGVNRPPLLAQGDVVTEMRIDGSGVMSPVGCDEIFQLRAYAMIRHPDGRMDRRDVTNRALWQAESPSWGTIVKKGEVTPRGGMFGDERIIARWDDGSAEHSARFEYHRESCERAI